MKRVHTPRPATPIALALLTMLVAFTVLATSCTNNDHVTYRHAEVTEQDSTVVAIRILPDETPPRWARDVSQRRWQWEDPSTLAEPFFSGPEPFVREPVDAGEPFYSHNHQPDIAWLPNGDLLAIWYTTEQEAGTELTVLASRLRAGQHQWDPSSEFLKVAESNMHGSGLVYDGEGTLYHFNGMGPAGGTYWAYLALLMRTSNDNGVTWSPLRAIGPEFRGRKQVIAGPFFTPDGALIVACDAVPTSHGGTALHISYDRGETWRDPGRDIPRPGFVDGATGRGTIAGIHAGVVALNNGGLLALGRGDSINGRMPMSISHDMGETWTYSASPFPPIGGGQRLVLKRLQSGPLMLVSFTGHPSDEDPFMTFSDEDGNRFRGTGLFAALSYDEGATWPVRRLITPGEGTFEGGAWTGRFTASDTVAEPRGYMAATQAPDGVIHLISSRLHYRFNQQWVEQAAPIH